MLKEIKKFIGRTDQHPRGVCVGATSIWLILISQNNLKKANKLKLEECDDLQSISLDGSFIWSEDLLPILKIYYDNSTIAEGQELTNCNIVDTIIKYSTPKPNRFWIIIATNSQNKANSHMMGVFYDGTSFYYINPDTGIYKGAIQEIAAHIFLKNAQKKRFRFSIYNGHLANYQKLPTQVAKYV